MAKKPTALDTPRSSFEKMNTSSATVSAPAAQHKSAQPPARVWTVYLGFVLAVLLLMLGSAGVVHAFHGDTTSPQFVTALLVVTAIVLTTVSGVAAGVSPVPFEHRLGLIGSLPGWRIVLLSVIATPALGTFLESLVALSGVQRSGSLLFLHETILASTPLELGVLALVMSVGPGIGEELLFRGYCQTRLVERHGKLVGVMLASLLFGLMHLDPVHSPLAAMMGMYLGYLAVAFGSIKLSIAAHLLNNLFATLSTAWLPDPEGHTPGSILACLLGLATFCLCIGTMRRISRDPQVA